MIRIGEAASGEQEALIWGSLPGEGSFCRQLSREKRGLLIKVLFVLIFSFAQGRPTERERSCWGVGQNCSLGARSFFFGIPKMRQWCSTQMQGEDARRVSVGSRLGRVSGQKREWQIMRIIFMHSVHPQLSWFVLMVTSWACIKFNYYQEDPADHLPHLITVLTVVGKQFS